MDLDPKNPIASLLKLSGAKVREVAAKMGVTTQAVHYHMSAGTGVKVRTLYDIAKICGAEIAIRFEKKNGKVEAKPIEKK